MGDISNDWGHDHDDDPGDASGSGGVSDREDCSRSAGGGGEGGVAKRSGSTLIYFQGPNDEEIFVRMNASLFHSEQWLIIICTSYDAH